MNRMIGIHVKVRVAHRHPEVLPRGARDHRNVGRFFGREIWNGDIPAEPTGGSSNVHAAWTKCKSGSGVKVLKKEHRSAEYPVS